MRPLGGRGPRTILVWVAGLALFAGLGGGVVISSGQNSASDPFDRAELEAAMDTLGFEYFRTRVEPILLRDRGGFGPGVSACVTCHVRSATPMPLEPLNVAPDGSVFWTEEQSRRNFTVLAALVVPGSPELSRLLREPLAVEAGGSPFHSGGKFWTTTADPEWQVLAEWIRADTDFPVSSSRAPTLDFEFFRNCVQRIFVEPRPGEVACTTCHSNGTRNFAREIPGGRDFWTEAESRLNFGVASRSIEPGYPLRSRLLTHPLHPEAGGDPFHGGGRRWSTQDDPEWQMLAEWVRGETPACVL